MKNLILVATAMTLCVACKPQAPASSEETSTEAAQPAAAPTEALPQFLEITEENYAYAETARNFRNWEKLGAATQLTHMRDFPPRGRAAPTVQMNDDTLYSAAIVEAIDGKVQFSIPEADVYLAVQVVNEGGHGEHYVVEPGEYDLPIETDFAFLIYRSGTEKGLEASRAAQDLISSELLNFGDYELPNFDFEEVEEWTARLTAETQGKRFAYTFPRTSAEVTDLHQWNLENANGWGGSSPEVGVANLYTNSVTLSADECLSTTFDDPESVYFTSVTAYDGERYLIDGAQNVNSNRWTPNEDGTITVSFNCGDDALNNIDTQGQDFSFTMRYYGVSQQVVDGAIAPETTVE